MLAQPFGVGLGCEPVSVACDGHDHPHDHDTPEDDSHGPDCPSTPHHHHHGAQCSPGQLLVADEVKHCRLATLWVQRAHWSHGDEPAPDGPVFSMDKPPLI